MAHFLTRILKHNTRTSSVQLRQIRTLKLVSFTVRTHLSPSDPLQLYRRQLTNKDVTWTLPNSSSRPLEWIHLTILLSSRIRDRAQCILVLVRSLRIRITRAHATPYAFHQPTASLPWNDRQWPSDVHKHCVTLRPGDCHI
jgi:hypothetical protein